MAKYKITNIINGMIIGITNKPIRNNDIVELTQNQLKQILYSANIKQVLSTGEEVGITLDNYTTDFENIIESKTAKEVTPLNLNDSIDFVDGITLGQLNDESNETLDNDTSDNTVNSNIDKKKDNESNETLDNTVDNNTTDKKENSAETNKVNKKYKKK